MEGSGPTDSRRGRLLLLILLDIQKHLQIAMKTTILCKGYGNIHWFSANFTTGGGKRIISRCRNSFQMYNFHQMAPLLLLLLVSRIILSQERCCLTFEQNGKHTSPFYCFMQELGVCHYLCTPNPLLKGKSSSPRDSLVQATISD